MKKYIEFNFVPNLYSDWNIHSEEYEFDFDTIEEFEIIYYDVDESRPLMKKGIYLDYTDGIWSVKFQQQANHCYQEFQSAEFELIKHEININLSHDQKIDNVDDLKENILVLVQRAHGKKSEQWQYIYDQNEFEDGDIFSQTVCRISMPEDDVTEQEIFRRVRDMTENLNLARTKVAQFFWRYDSQFLVDMIKDGVIHDLPYKSNDRMLIEKLHNQSIKLTEHFEFNLAMERMLRRDFSCYIKPDL